MGPSQSFQLWDSSHIDDFDRNYLKMAKSVASALLMSHQYYNSFVKNAPGAQCIHSYDEFQNTIKSVKFQLLVSRSGNNYGESARHSINVNKALLDDFEFRKRYKRKIFLDAKLLSIMIRGPMFKKADESDLIHISFLVAVILIHEVSHILNFIYNFSSFEIINNIYRTPESQAGKREFGEAMEIALFGELLSVNINPEKFSRSVVNVRLIRQYSGNLVMKASNVNKTLIDSILADPETSCILQFVQIDEAIDTTSSSVARRECYKSERPEEKKEDLIV